MMRVNTRAMAISDLPAMMTLQVLCFPDIEPESEVSLKAKLQASPSTCFVAESGHRLMGYLITHPWTSKLPPELNSATCEIPDNPDCLYIHDLSVHPDARGTGTSKALLEHFSKRFNDSPFDLSALVAVQNSQGFWKKQGFEIEEPNEVIKKKLDSYGTEAHYMLKRK